MGQRLAELAREPVVHRSIDPYAKDEVLATAILDRLQHKAHVLNIKGRGYRLRDLEQSLGM